MKSLGSKDAKRAPFFLIHLALLMVLTLAIYAQAQAISQHTPSPALQQALASELHQGGDAQALAAVYVGTNPTPYWLSDSGLNERGMQALEALHNASAHGLNPERYGIDEIEATLLNDTAPGALAKADTQISLALIRYVQDLKAGATDARWHDKLGTTEARPAPRDIWATLITSPKLGAYLSRQAPASPLYASLQRVLATYSNLAQHGGWPVLAGGPTLKPTMHDPRLATLQQRLALTGDYEGTQAAAPASYSGELVAAVQHFQSRHGLEPDGVVGPATLAALNVPVEQRIDQLRVTMDEVRQLPDRLSDKFILVNIPSYRLTAYEGGKATLQMKVVVGQPKRPTPSFSNQITQAVFNPEWSVPPRIIREDLPKKIAENPDYLTSNHFTVMQNGTAIDPSLVNWQEATNYSFHQASGSGNALGKIKFPIPDNQSVYLHDTAHRELFAKAERDLSSGCIRVEQPEALAQFVLKNNQGWDEAKVASTYKASTPRTVTITPVPVHAVYWTAWVDEHGTPHFYNDIYKRDGAVLAALDDTAKPATTQMASR